jgi:hypothetical protein
MDALSQLVKMIGPNMFINLFQQLQGGGNRNSSFDFGHGGGTQTDVQNSQQFALFE